MEQKKYGPFYEGKSIRYKNYSRYFPHIPPRYYVFRSFKLDFHSKKKELLTQYPEENKEDIKTSRGFMDIRVKRTEKSINLNIDYMNVCLMYTAFPVHRG